MRKMATSAGFAFRLSARDGNMRCARKVHKRGTRTPVHYYRTGLRVVY
jgi:hypothetical protein